MERVLGRGRRSRWLVVLVLGVVFGLLGLLLTMPLAPAASASCAVQAMQGDWRNIDPGTRSMTRVEVGFHCGDHVICDLEGNCTGGESSYTLRPSGRCHPTDCDWGTRRAQDMGGGWQRAVYFHSWAIKYVWVKTYEYYGRTYLRVWVSTDFTVADGRADYVTDEWMLK